MEIILIIVLVGVIINCGVKAVCNSAFKGAKKICGLFSKRNRQ